MNGKTRHVCQKNVKKQGLTQLAAILSNIEFHYDGNAMWWKSGVTQILKGDMSYLNVSPGPMLHCVSRPTPSMWLVPF